MRNFEQSMYSLIEETSTVLPGDVRRAIAKAERMENEGTRAALALTTISDNIGMATHNALPICQDTGYPTFFVRCPVGANQLVMKEQITNAIVRATMDGKLRPNSVDSLTGLNSGNSLGEGIPVIHFEQWERDDIEVKLILKGGGCENKNMQYSLPTELEGLGRASRDLDGIRKCIMHAIYQAQGFGCSAGFIGVGIGGDRTSGYDLAKRQLFRAVDDVNPITELRELEEYAIDNGNKLGIGTMGFGGKATILGCKVAAIHRVPASFYVSVAYNCWAFRRQGVLIDAVSGEINSWQYERGGLYKDNVAEQELDAMQLEQETNNSRVVHLQTPLSEDDVRELKVGDVVVIDGPLITGRDALHKYFMDHESPIDLNGAALYHCGPVIMQDQEGVWHVKAAGPTTSMREEPYQDHIIKKFGIRAVIGKGGMGAKTLKALQEHGGVYLNAIGGAAQYYAQTIQNVNGVHFLEQFGSPEAMWQFQVKGFTAIVTMDSHGNSLHEDIEKTSLEKLEKLAEPVYA